MSPQQIATTIVTSLILSAPLGASQATPAAPPPDARILGVVIDENNKPVVGALVLLGDGRSTETGADGRFSFVRVRPGAHEIAAVTSSCEVAAGGFNVTSGKDALLQLIVEPQPSATGSDNRARGRGTESKVVEADRLAAFGNRSALDALEELAAQHFQVVGGRLVVRARAGLSVDNSTEPLLVMDGVRMTGMIADALRSIKAGDLARLELHLGNAAGWEFQNHGASAVIEITTRTRPLEDQSPLLNPETCFARNRR